VDESFKRGTGEVADLVGDSSAARDRLGWAPTLGFDELVRLMVKADLEQMS
jgi:GDPmannose 4,6-dehydratase